MADVADANLVTKVLSSDSGRERWSRYGPAPSARVTRMLDCNRHLVEALREALVDRDELVGDEIGEVIAQPDQTVIDLRQLRQDA